MKKKQLSKLALMGLATGAMMASTVTLSAHAVTETKGTYLAGGCGGSGKCGGSNKAPSSNYTTDNYNPTTNTVVNPNMAPKPEAMQGNAPQNQVNKSSCSAQKQVNGQGSCSAQKQINGQAAPSHSCGGSAPVNGQGSGSCGARRL